jgi:hypothetical protein
MVWLSSAILFCLLGELCVSAVKTLLSARKSTKPNGLLRFRLIEDWHPEATTESEELSPPDSKYDIPRYCSASSTAAKARDRRRKS